MNLEDLYRLLRSGHVQAQGVMDTIEDPLVVLDAKLMICVANPAFFRTFGLDRDATIGRGLFELRNGEWDKPELRVLMEAVLPKSAAIVDYEIQLATSASVRKFALSARRLTHPDGNSANILVVLRDLSATIDAMTHQNILLAESQHRMKNQLAVLRALIMQTEIRGRSSAEYREALLQRFSTFADAQELTEKTETGTVSIKSLLARVLRSFDNQIRMLPGPDTSLEKSQILPLSHVFNELLTNAAKYGSLSDAKGAVEVGWTIDDGKLTVTWTEIGGPPVRAPEHKGFGSRLVNYSINNDLGGTMEQHFEVEGLRVSLKLPVK